MKMVGDFFSFQNGYAFKSKDFVHEGKYKIVKIKELKDGLVQFFDDTTEVDLLDNFDFNKYIIRKGDVLFALTGDPVNKPNPLSWVGRVAYYNYDEPALLNQRVCKAIPKTDIPSDFLYYFFRQNREFYRLASKATGSASQANISTKTIEQHNINIPDVENVKKIVTFLKNIDDKILYNNRINRNLSEQASAYYENWKMSLTGGAVELSKVIDVRDGTHASPKPQDEGYPLVTSKHLFEYDVDLESPNKISQDDYDKTNERSKVEYHDVLMSMIGTVGVVSFISRQEINFAIKNVALFRTSQREELAYYVLLFLKSKDTKQYIKSCMAGSTQQYISLTELRKIPIIVPGEEIKEFNLVIKPIIDMICANVIENRRLSELRDTLLPKLMSGELDVSDLDI